MMKKHNGWLIALVVTGILFIAAFMALLVLGPLLIFRHLSKSAEGYARIETSPQNSTWIYVKGDKVFSAPSSAALEKSIQTGAAATEENQAQTVSLTAVDLKASGWEQAEAALMPSMGDCSAEWTLSRKDAGGKLWLYTVSQDIPLARTVADCRSTTVPQLRKWKLEVETAPKVEDKEASIGIGVRLKADDYEVSNIFHDSKMVPVHLRLTDSSGKVVRDEDKDLSDMGFG
jgi:hypothetical protein